jgi:hypothetical protein
VDPVQLLNQIHPTPGSSARIRGHRASMGLLGSTSGVPSIGGKFADCIDVPPGGSDRSTVRFQYDNCSGWHRMIKKGPPGGIAKGWDRV